MVKERRREFKMIGYIAKGSEFADFLLFACVIAIALFVIDRRHQYTRWIVIGWLIVLGFVTAGFVLILH